MNNNIYKSYININTGNQLKRIYNDSALPNNFNHEYKENPSLVTAHLHDLITSCNKIEKDKMISFVDIMKQQNFNFSIQYFLCNLLSLYSRDGTETKKTYLLLICMIHV